MGLFLTVCNRKLHEISHLDSSSEHDSAEAQVVYRGCISYAFVPVHSDGMSTLAVGIFALFSISNVSHLSTTEHGQLRVRQPEQTKSQLSVITNTDIIFKHNTQSRVCWIRGCLCLEEISLCQGGEGL